MAKKTTEPKAPRVLSQSKDAVESRKRREAKKAKLTVVVPNPEEVRATARVQAKTILERSCTITLSLHWLGNHRVVDTEEVVEAFRPEAQYELESPSAPDKATVRSIKELIDKRELREARGIIGKAKALLRSYAIPTPRVFGDRSYLVPIGVVEIVEARLIALQGELATACAALASRYETAVQNQRAKLGTLFNEADYKTPSEIAESYAIEWDWVSFSAPERLTTVNRALFERAQTRYEGKMAAAYDEVRLALRETCLRIVREITKKLEPDETGKRKAFRDTVLDDLTEFLSTFRLRSITNDADLDGVVATLQQITSGVNVDALRDDEKLRASLLVEAKKVTGHLDALVIPLRRAIRLPGQSLPGGRQQEPEPVPVAS
jgi:hypothetical protein